MTDHFPISIVAGDFNYDTKLDLEVVTWIDGFLSILLANGNGTFQNQFIYVVDPLPTLLTAGAFREDTRLGMAAAKFGDSSITIFYNLCFYLIDLLAMKIEHS